MLTSKSRPGIDPAGIDGVLVSSASAVTWSAIFAGAFAAAALTLALLIFGSGIGIAAFSPGSAVENPKTLSIITIIWLIIVQWVSSGLGGYLAGRLRTKWVGVHSDEVFFRDTAHGFLAWCIATLLSAAIALSAVSSASNIGVFTVAMQGAGGAAVLSGIQDRHGPEFGPKAEEGGPISYLTDSLYRTDHPNPGVPQGEIREETMRILLNVVKDDGVVNPEDKEYLAQLVSARTALPLPDAEKRVDAVLQHVNEEKDKMQKKTEEARKIAATLSIFTFLSMLIGAFIASVSAALGGHRRDEY